MAYVISNLPLPPLFTCEKRPFCTPLHKHTVSAVGGQQGRVAVIAKATSRSSESSTSLSVVESVQNFWDKPEDRIALVGFGFASVVALWVSLNMVTAIDKLPIVPSVFELIGILFSTWFVYRSLLFKPDRIYLLAIQRLPLHGTIKRKELVEAINKSVSDILGR